MLQTKQNEDKMRVIKAINKRDANGRIRTPASSTAVTENASAMLGMTRNSAINFNP